MVVVGIIVLLVLFCTVALLYSYIYFLASLFVATWALVWSDMWVCAAPTLQS